MQTRSSTKKSRFVVTGTDLQNLPPIAEELQNHVVVADGQQEKRGSQILHELGLKASKTTSILRTKQLLKISIIIKPRINKTWRKLMELVQSQIVQEQNAMIAAWKQKKTESLEKEVNVRKRQRLVLLEDDLAQLQSFTKRLMLLQPFLIASTDEA